MQDPRIKTQLDEILKLTQNKMRRRLIRPIRQTPPQVELRKVFIHTAMTIGFPIVDVSTFLGQHSHTVHRAFKSSLPEDHLQICGEICDIFHEVDCQESEVSGLLAEKFLDLHSG